jgi:hypothetical protein
MVCGENVRGEQKVESGKQKATAGSPHPQLTDEKREMGNEKTAFVGAGLGRKTTLRFLWDISTQTPSFTDRPARRKNGDV